MEKKDTFLKIIVVITFLVMIVANLFGMMKPFGMKSIKEISASYPNLLTPVDRTFAIWGVIYLLLLGFVIYQLGIFGKNRHKNEKELLHQARILFVATGLLNAAWITAWLSDYMALSVMIIWVMLIALQILGRTIRKEYLNGREKLFIRLPFSLYYGWITLAAILNTVTLLVSIQWNVWGLSDSVWFVLLMIIITGVGMHRTLKNKDITYCLALLWGLIGILEVHISANGWNKEYPTAIFSVMVGINLLTGCIVFLLLLRKRKAI